MKLQSFLSSAIEGYIKYRQASGRTSKSYVKNVILFDHYCAREYPNQKDLTQEIADRWCAVRDTETSNSCVSRIYPILDLFKYMKKRGMTNIKLPPVPKSTPRTYIPHAFTNMELKRFFHACDTIKPRRGKLSAIQRITIPVLFRLLYSSGMRTTEIIALERIDVNLDNGVISVKRGKGYNQHFVVLHDSMLSLMRLYDSRISELVPNRRCFFPSPDDHPHSPVWITNHFRVLWESCNDTHAIAYDLRHNYAIENINSWSYQGFCVHDNLLSLSKSMGHRDIASTMKYYALTPAISDIMASAETYEKLNTEDHEKKD